MFITMLGDSTAFASLVFGYFYYWTVHDEFPPPESHSLNSTWIANGTLAAVLGWMFTCAAKAMNRSNRIAGFHGCFAMALLLTLFSGWAMVNSLLAGELEPTRHAYEAIVWVLVGWTVLHVGVGSIMLLYCWARRLTGCMTSKYDADMANVTCTGTLPPLPSS